MPSRPNITVTQARFYRVIGRSVGIKIGALLLFLALVVYLAGGR